MRLQPLHSGLQTFGPGVLPLKLRLLLLVLAALRLQLLLQGLGGLRQSPGLRGALVQLLLQREGPCQGAAQGLAMRSCL